MKDFIQSWLLPIKAIVEGYPVVGVRLDREGPFQWFQDPLRDSLQETCINKTFQRCSDLGSPV